MQLRSLETIASKKRNPVVDVFRAVAIISVVLFHFKNFLPYGGGLGVDLFFVISGLLVWGLLTKDFEAGRKIRFGRFFLQRAFKIWPSYYCFLISGSLLAYILYRSSAPDQLIPLSEAGRYIFFYQNYFGPHHYSFDQVWSLCVEEHFYIVLPVALIIAQSFRWTKRALFIGCISIILLGILLKFLSFYFTNSQETYYGTHNRIDALAWGFLLNLLVRFYPGLIKKASSGMIVFMLGLLSLAALIAIDIHVSSPIYHKVLFYSLTSISFFLMLASSYYVDLSRWKFLRFIAYYSYNWYLWHTIFVVFVSTRIGNNWMGLSLYLILSFATAMLFTVLIEEPFLNLRAKVMTRSKDRDLTELKPETIRP